MIKILIVLEEEDSTDFRAYSLQISNQSKNSPPRIRMNNLVEGIEKLNGDSLPSQATPSGDGAGEENSLSFVHQMKRPLETRQIFMN